MRHLQILGFILISISTFGQSIQDSVYKYILDEYLPNRIKTNSFYIQIETCNNVGLNHLINDKIMKHDTIYSHPDWILLINMFDSINEQSNKINDKYLNYSFIKKSSINKQLNRIISKNGVMVKDPLYNWNEFQSKFPDCKGIVSLSMPIFSGDKTKFLIFVDYYNLNKKGFGDLLFGVKKDNKWNIINEINLIKPIEEEIVIGD